MGGRDLTIIIDPILRASRLDQTLEFVEEARRDGTDVALVTRTLIPEEEQSLPQGLEVRQVLTFPDGFWFGHLEGVQVWRLLATCDDILRARGDRAVRVRISGLNELLGTRLIAGMLRFGLLASSPIVAVHYDSNVILLKRPSLRRFISSLQKRFLLRLLLAVSRNLQVCYPDERVLEAGFDPSVAYKPDPFVHPFGRLEPKQLEPDRITLLFVGRQDERKGLGQLLGLIEAHDVRRYRIRVVGPNNEGIPEITGRVAVRSEFVSNEALWDELATADYVVLPYSRAFDSASGVFVWATISGTPLITSDHGFLSYMVGKYALGYVFDDRAPGGLAEFLKASETLLLDQDEYRKMSANCIDYSQRHRVGSDAKADIRH